MNNVPMTRAEDALAVHEQDFGHAVSMVEWADGRILLVAGEQFCTSDDGGLTWSAPAGRSDANGDPVGGIAMVRLSGEGVGLVGMRTVGRYGWHELLFRRSEDGGQTWQPPVVCSSPGFPSHILQDVLLRTSSGRIILPVYFSIGQGAWRAEDAPFPGALYKGHFVSTDAHYFDPHFGACYICYSDDDGRTWQRNKDGELFIGLEYGSVFGAVYEPSAAEVSPGKLMMLMRTGLGRLYQAWSEDDGETWSRPEPTSLAACHSPAQIRSLPGTGHLLCVWNQHSREEIRRGLGRTRLSCAVSRNGGGVWEFFRNVQSIHETTRVETGPIGPVRPEEVYALAGRPAVQREAEYVQPLPEGFGCWSYPSVLVLKGRLLISHTFSVYNDAGERIRPGGSSRLKVFPLKWAYGGGDPNEENPILTKVSVPPTP